MARYGEVALKETRELAARYLISAIIKLDVNELERCHIDAMVNPLRPVLRNWVPSLASRSFR